MDRNDQSGMSTQRLPGGTLLRGRYQIMDVLGQGGFGITYGGYDTVLNMNVAIKEYYPREIAGRFATQSPQVFVEPGNEALMEHGKKQFLEEARALARFIKEPNIVTVHDFFEENGTAYIIMEYIEGQSLSDLLGSHGIYSFEEAWQFLRPVALVLKKLHAVNIIHRDISPINILMDSDGLVKLIDFGAARAYDTSRSVSVIVKPGYAPLEQYQSRGKQGPWSDVYSLTATLYRLITGKIPDNALDRSFDDQVKPASDYNPDITKEQDNVVAKGLALSVQERFRNMDELVRAMDSAAGEPFRNTQPAVGEPFHNTQPAAGAYKVNGKEDMTASGDAAYSPNDYDEDLTVSDASMLRFTGAASRQQKPEDKHLQQVPNKKVPDRQVSDQQVPEKQNAAKQVPDKQNAVKQTSSNAVSGKKDKTRGQRSKKTVSGKTGSRSRKLPVIAGSAAVLCALIIAGIFLFSGNLFKSKYASSSGTSAYLSKETITKGIIHSIDRDKRIEDVSFSQCEISDEAMKRIGSMKRIKKITFSQCRGFTSFDPLADLDTLESIYLSFGSGSSDAAAVDLDSAITRVFENVKSLQVVTADLQGKTGFLEKFPAVTYLTWNYLQNAYDLKGLAGMPALTDFSSTDTDLSRTDMSDFTHCPDLKYLSFTNSRISDISSWSTLSNLYLVRIDSGQISDLSGLSGSAGTLGSLTVTDNLIASLEPLASFTALRSLDVSDNQLTSLKGLEQVTTITELDASGNQISDISALAGHTNLTGADLSHNRIADLRALSESAGLKRIDVCDNQLTSLAGLENALELEKLTADGNQISSLDGIVNTSLLKKVYLADNRISDLSILGKSSATLESLWASDNQISDISCLKEAAVLKDLIIDGNSISDLSPLAGDSALEILAVDRNQILDLGPVAGLTGLKALCASENQIRSISALKDLSSLQLLDLSYNQIADISLFSDLAVDSIRLLLCHNNIAALPQFSSATKFDYLSIYANPIKDLSGLSSALCRWNDSADGTKPERIFSRGDTTLTWVEGLNPDDVLPCSGAVITIVDCPLDKQAAIKKRFGEHYIGDDFLRFRTLEEADTELAEKRAQIFTPEKIKGGLTFR